MSEQNSARLPHAYRIFKLDSAGRYVATEGLDAADDQDAFTQARCIAAGQPVELWDRDRVLVRIGPDCFIKQ